MDGIRFNHAFLFYQSFTTISSGIAPEAELAIGAEDKGVNSSTRNLVLAAISVMKGRKARPDTKRICNWVNRKYGRSVQEVVQAGQKYVSLIIYMNIHIYPIIHDNVFYSLHLSVNWQRK